MLCRAFVVSLESSFVVFYTFKTWSPTEVNSPTLAQFRVIFNVEMRVSMGIIDWIVVVEC